MTLKLSSLTRSVALFGTVAIQCFAATPARSLEDHASHWRPIVISANDLDCLIGAERDNVAVFSCASNCEAIPWQLDERDAAGGYALTSGPMANPDVEPGRVDRNDEIALMWSDAGDRTSRAIAGDPSCAEEVSIQLGNDRRFVYVTRFAHQAPRSKRRYVEYDVDADRMSGDTVMVGFGASTPRDLALRRGPAAGRDLLDRLSIRAYARFFGVFPLQRDEDDILSVYEAWKAGPIRVIRRERKWVRLAFGFRTPYMKTETMFYRDFARLPVTMRLNYPPASLLSAIEIRAVLDFVNLRGWQLWVQGGGPARTVGEVDRATAARLSRVDDASVLALRGADATLALVLRLGPSLRSLSKTVSYFEGDDPMPPEEFVGALPAIGFTLSRWGEVDRGRHHFVAESYALPGGYDPERFAREIDLVPSIDVRPH